MVKAQTAAEYDAVLTNHRWSHPHVGDTDIWQRMSRPLQGSCYGSVAGVVATTFQWALAHTMEP